MVQKYSLFAAVRGSVVPSVLGNTKVAPGRRVWHRISEHAFTLKMARKFYQSQLIANALGLLDGNYEYRLRVVNPANEHQYAETPVEIQWGRKGNYGTRFDRSGKIKPRVL
jgi:hypothetical protein